MCNCVELMDEQLKTHNTMLDLSLIIRASTDMVRVNVATMKLDSKKRGKSATIIATYCPFCGKEYGVDEEAQ